MKLFRLSPRLRQVALLVSQGLTNKEIAKEMGLRSAGVVKVYLSAQIFNRIPEVKRSRVRLAVLVHAEVAEALSYFASVPV